LIETETLEILQWHRLCQQLSTYTSTKLGKIAACSLVIPDTLEDSLELLAQTQEIYNLRLQLVSWTFDGIEDIGNALERSSLGGVLTGRELLEIATTLYGVRRLRRTIEALEKFPTLQQLVSQVRTYPELEQIIHYSLDDHGKVTERSSPKLAQIRSKLKEQRDRIYQKLQNIINKQANLLQEMVITQRGDRFVLPVKSHHKEQIPGVVHDSSATGATLYIEPYNVVELGNSLRQLVRQEQIEEEKILADLSGKIKQHQEDLEYLLLVVTKLDLATARADYSIWLEAHPPKFIDLAQGESIALRQVRHPLLVWQQIKEHGVQVVPSSIFIKPPVKVVAITGPNTGGKTVTLKTLGLVCLMAKVGLFIPAKEPVEIPWFAQILADIGDEQSIEQNLSTFSGHIRRIVRIINSLEQQPSLVLLDEIGAGTDPQEGSALAIALLQYLANKNSLTFSTTHYGELKALKYQDERFENASMEFDDETLSPTYKLLWGIPGRSNALSVAKRLGLPEDILEQAQMKIGGYSSDINQMITALENQKKEQEENARQSRELLAQSERFYQEIAQKAASLQERERNLKLHQQQEIQTAIDQAKAEIAKVIRELQQAGNTAQNAQKASQLLQTIADSQLPQWEKQSEYYQPKIGEKVKIISLGQTAEVISLDLAGEKLTVNLKFCRATVPLSDVESIDGKKVESITTKPSVQSSPPETLMVKTSQNTLDLRGLRILVAQSEIDKALSGSVNFGSLWIIHGKGTGKLREGVHEYLKDHPQVKSFALADLEDGGSGVTLVKLR